MNIAPLSTSAAWTVHTNRASQPQAETTDSVDLDNRPQPEVCFPFRPGFQQVEGLPHMSVKTVQAEDVDTPEERTALANEMVGFLQEWPGAKTVVTVVEGQPGQTSVVVAERDKAVEQPVLEGSYEVVQRLASSKFIKENAHKYPSSYHAVTAFDPEGKTKEVVLPGNLTGGEVTAALQEGRAINQYDMLDDLVDNLPQGERVVLLVGGPSAAGKSTLISKIKECAEGRDLSVIEGDMYFNDVDQAGYPTTTEGTHYWDHPDFMDIDGLKKDLTELLETGEADIPVYNFSDTPPGPKRAWAPEWRIPTTVTGFREDTPHHVTVGDDSIIVLDSIHATHPDIVKYFEDQGLAYRNVYLDSPSSEDRLMRRIVRDYEKRGGRSVEESMDIWDLTTWRGEKEFIRPGILSMDPSRDVALVLQFPLDPEMTREEMEAKAAVMKEYGVAPSYEAFTTPDEGMAELARQQEAKLEGVLASADADARTKETAQRELDALRAAPRYQA